MMSRVAAAIALVCGLAGCAEPVLQPSPLHLQASVASARAGVDAPPPLERVFPLPSPAETVREETWSVAVSDVPVQEVLQALAQGAKVDIDIHPGLQGSITLNALEQTLPQLLERISRQVEMRWELENGVLSVVPDTPILRNYRIDYVNMARDADTALANASQVGGYASVTAQGNALTGNNSVVLIRNSTRNHFWETLVQNIKDLLHETDKVLPEGSSETVVQQSNLTVTSGTGAPSVGSRKPASRNANAPAGIENSPNPASVQEGGTTVTRRSTFREAASVIANPETGVLSVRATGRQHERVREFIHQVMDSARRQVLIEATVVEVKLSDQYQQGINWSLLQRGGSGVQMRQAASVALPATPTGSLFVLDYLSPLTRLGSLSAQVSLLESFGSVKVLSSPKLSVLNNQSAMLRVVDNLVYFTIKADTTTNQTNTVTTFTTTPNTLPIGFTMSVTPQISDSESVTLNLKPSVTRVIGYVNDPNPDLARLGVISRIPQTQTREMESVLKVDSRQVAVLGGLMQDQVSRLDDTVPGINRLPLLGQALANRNHTTEKTELVIFLRPIVVRQASLQADYRDYRAALPDGGFFGQDERARP